MPTKPATATLTATQRAVLEAAATHPQGFLTAYPENVNGGARVLIATLTALPALTSADIFVT